MNLSPTAKSAMQRDLAKRLKALGGDVGDPETITHDERSLLRILEGIVSRLEAAQKTKERA